MVLNEVGDFAKKFLDCSGNKKIHLVSHFDTDGITSATILAKTFGRMGKQFSVKILKQLTEEEIKSLPKDRLIFLADLGSGSLKELEALDQEIFIIDHHEITEKQIPANIKIVNTHLMEEYENLCSAELVYFFSRMISNDNLDLSYLAIMGAVGDTLEKEISKSRDNIIKDSKVQIKKGLLLYPSTRPIDKTLEFSSEPFIPGVTGDRFGCIDLLKESGIEKIGKLYPPLIDLNENEMKKLTTAILLRMSSEKSQAYIGNLYLIKFFNRIEDARELSAIVNACSRMGNPEVAFMMCMGNHEARKKAERIYVKYRQHIISGLKFIEKNNHIKGQKYIIINAKDNIKDTIIGTLASILSFSSVYSKGTIIIAMAYNENKIKVSARIAGKNPKEGHNLKELIESITRIIGGEFGGHDNAAGCTINKTDEERFIDLMKRRLDLELIKIPASQEPISTLTPPE
jgi:single-stranded-DNA-specific exonuclease